MKTNFRRLKSSKIDLYRELLYKSLLKDHRLTEEEKTILETLQIDKDIQDYLKKIVADHKY